MKKWLYAAYALILTACSNPEKTTVPVIGFADAFEDNTLSMAREGFVKALADSGYEEDRNTIKIIYRNAQGSVPALSQMIQYFKSQEVAAIATCPTLPTITALQATKTIPVFMMVAPEPSLMKIKGRDRQVPSNLYGVGENLDYIDSSFLLISQLIKPADTKLKIGMLYNPGEVQSIEALSRIRTLAARTGMEVLARPVTSSSETQLAVRSLLADKIDAFFANPDNIVFSSFETLAAACKQAAVPIFTSEAGLVRRGAVAAYGADIYAWGYQAGAQCARFLKQGNTRGIQWEMVKKRTHIYNPAVASALQLSVPAHFTAQHP